MADGTRFRVIDDNIKALQDFSEAIGGFSIRIAIRSEFDRYFFGRYEEDYEQGDSSATQHDSELAEPLPLEDATQHSAISYNALAGGTSATILRFTGMVKGQPVQVLVDGGITHCFVQTRVAKFLNLTIEPISPFFSHGWDMVLGVSWLSTLGPVITYYANSSFEFTVGKDSYHWQGETTPALQPVQFNSLCKLAQADAIAAFYHLTLYSPFTNSPNPCPDDILPILQEFSLLFSNPLKGYHRYVL
ncbi:hypothetical protein E3N88_29834 [Mikania micrantha]|uniref:Uncharacterized protein n=1 Tax=Mikania micrantha TaxID=192012 RepID=A0A5N6MJX0_9ASTR|nr:hypothetical protein E3N88_29834 [Mikania micrantha]